MDRESVFKVSVTWRNQRLELEVSPKCTVQQFGVMLLELISIKPETMKLIVPQSKGSKLIAPFSDAQSSSYLSDIGVLEGRTIRMMGVFEDEIEQVSQKGRIADSRIIGFDEEDQRMKQRASYAPQLSLKLPQGPYTFGGFRTLHIPGIELNPPGAEALKRMHMLACDPGIIAIMNKHRWQVGIMTEMAPVGYVGISPKCILGFNKNQGEEISLRLRTDDLKGFRKYERIKKTLLHELAHMVHSEHDANFFALNKQLNEEAAALDWTKSKGHVLSGKRISDSYEEEFVLQSSNDHVGHKLGGAVPNSVASASSMSGAAAYQRFLDTEAHSSSFNEVIASRYAEPDPDANVSSFLEGTKNVETDPDDTHSVPLTAVLSNSVDSQEPDPEDVIAEDVMNIDSEPDPDNCRHRLVMDQTNMLSEPDPDASTPEKFSEMLQICENDGSKSVLNDGNCGRRVASLQDSGPKGSCADPQISHMPKQIEPSLHGTSEKDITGSGNSFNFQGSVSVFEPDPDYMGQSDSTELQIIKDRTAAVCVRLQKAIEMLRAEVTSSEIPSVIQTLLKIIKNVVDHPYEPKYRKLRKSNPLFQKNVASYKAATEVLETIGFYEDVLSASDGTGQPEAYMVLKRDDPGLLWLAKSTLEVPYA